MTDEESTEGDDEAAEEDGEAAPLDQEACDAAGNHGEYVSFIAHLTKGDPGHGVLVSDAAHSDCGKASAEETTEPTDEATDEATESDESGDEAKVKKPKKDKKEKKAHKAKRTRRPRATARARASTDLHVLTFPLTCSSAHDERLTAFPRSAVRHVWLGTARSGLLGAPRVPVPHPLRVAHDGSVVRRDAEPVRELVCRPGVTHPAAGPLTGVGDEHDCGRGDGRGRLDERLDAGLVPGKPLEVLGVGGVGLAHLPAPATPLPEQSHPGLQLPSIPVYPTNGRGPDKRSDHPRTRLPVWAHPVKG